MEYPRPKVTIDNEEYELLSIEEFRQKVDCPELPIPTISYNIDHDSLDYCRLGTFRYIIWNEKAKNFTVLKRRPRNKSKLSLE